MIILQFLIEPTGYNACEGWKSGTIGLPILSALNIPDFSFWKLQKCVKLEQTADRARMA